MILPTNYHFSQIFRWIALSVSIKLQVVELVTAEYKVRLV